MTERLTQFVLNTIVPDRKVVLIALNDGPERGPLAIWYGWITEMPEADFARADEAHVSQWTYDRIAEQAAATGKGIRLQ